MLNIKISSYLKSPSKVMALFGLVTLIALSFMSPLGAQAVTTGYGSDQPLQRGMLVQLKKDDATKVEPVSQNNMEKLHGVVVDANDAPVTLSAEGSKVFVATDGQYELLVTSQNGAIAAGDYITVSALDGVGMKAGTIEPIIIGRALGAFDGKTNVISTTNVKDSAGTTKSVAIGRVQVDILVAKNPLLRGERANVPEFLRKASQAIAGKEVSTVRIYLSLVVFVVCTVIAGILMYGGVRSAIISIGRNPLSKKAIVRGMIQVILVGLTIFITGVFGVYLLLKL